MKARFATDQEINNWNDLVVSNPDGGNTLQGKEFSETKANYGWKPRFIVIDDIYITALERKVPIIGHFWYIPKGPGVTSIEQLQKIVPAIKELAKENHAFFVRLEPEIVRTKDSLKTIQTTDLRLKPGVQIPSTIVIDTTLDIDDLLASFSPKTRYNIRAAKKAKINTKLVPINDHNCQIFYDLMIETIQGRAFLRPLNYFKKFWQSHFTAKTGLFFFAEHDGKIISTDFISLLGQKATRKDAASTKQRTVRGASALLELEVIKHLKEIGITSYDLCGCPPADQIKNPDHQYYGIGTFKSGFNDQVTDYIGCLDLVINQRIYKAWDKIAERLVKKLYFYLKHDLYF